MDLHHCQTVLERAGVTFEPGLSDAEISAAEQRFDLQFPTDLREFLSFALPVGGRFPNWRRIDDPNLAQALSWPLEGMCFDIKHNTFWPHEWGARPPEAGAAFAIAQSQVEQAPKLIPINGHRYMPSRPLTAGNPVFSVYQTDIIYYGGTLENYLHNEYHYYFATPAHSLPASIRHIEFWSWLVELNT